MTHADDLERVVRAALHQLSLIEARLARTGLGAKEAERNVALCLIDAQSTWSLFVRSFFVSCFIGAKRGGGGRVTTTASGPYTPAHAIQWASVTMDSRLAAKLAKKKKLGPLDEPRWHQALTLPRLAGYAKLSNEAQILTAFAVPGRALDDLPTARNFFAHRSHHTAKTLKTLAPQYGLPKNIRAGEIPGHPHMTRPGSIAEYWVAQIIAMVRLLPT